MAQLVKNPPAMQETWVRSLDWEDLLEKGKANHSSILAWRIESSKKHESSRKTSISALLIMPKPLTVWITINCGKF